MSLSEELESILEKLSVINNIEKQQALKYIIMELKVISDKLDLDFDLALDKSDPETNLKCNHREAYPYCVDSVYCPICKESIVKGKISVTPISDYLKENHWRP
jgi:hypothetical protein